LIASALEIYGMMDAQTPSDTLVEGTNLVWDMMKHGKAFKGLLDRYFK
jgi:hypothetical protein